MEDDDGSPYGQEKHHETEHEADKRQQGVSFKLAHFIQRCAGEHGKEHKWNASSKQPDDENGSQSQDKPPPFRAAQAGAVQIRG